LINSQLLVSDASRSMSARSCGRPVAALLRFKSDLPMMRTIGSPFDAVASQWSLATYAANTNWVTNNRGVAARVSAVLRQTAVWANANQQQSGKVLVNYLKMSEVAVSSMTRCEYSASLKVSNLQPSLDVMAKYGYLPKDIDASTLITHV
jgi:ABC-type nitrate/sulfonate/bicarbonate transport system substrate-binding protein